MKANVRSFVRFAVPTLPTRFLPEANREKIIRGDTERRSFPFRGKGRKRRAKITGTGRMEGTDFFERRKRLEERSRGHDLEQFLLSKRRGKRIRPGTKGWREKRLADGGSSRRLRRAKFSARGTRLFFRGRTRRRRSNKPSPRLCCSKAECPLTTSAKP